jgi:hypothetical protein
LSHHLLDGLKGVSLKEVVGNLMRVFAVFSCISYIIGGALYITLTLRYQLVDKYFTFREVYKEFLKKHSKTYAAFIGHLDPSSEEGRRIARRFLEIINCFAGLVCIAFGSAILITRSFDQVPIVVLLMPVVLFAHIISLLVISRRVQRGSSHPTGFGNEEE